MGVRTYKHDDPVNSTRTCKACLSVLAITPVNYYRDKTKPLGFSVVCKPCMTAIRHAKKPVRVTGKRKRRNGIRQSLTLPKKANESVITEAIPPSPSQALLALVRASVAAGRGTRDIQQFNRCTDAFGAAASAFVDTIVRNPRITEDHFGRYRPISPAVIEAGLRYDAGEPCTDFDKATNRPLTPTPSDEAMMFSYVLNTSASSALDCGPQSAMLDEGGDVLCLPTLGLDLWGAAIAAGLNLRSPYATP